MFEGNVGLMIEEKLDKAGVELKKGYRLVAMDLPVPRPGEITVDVTNHSRIFSREPRSLRFTYAVGASFKPDLVKPDADKNDVKKALQQMDMKVGWCTLMPFIVHTKKETLKLGGIISNRKVEMQCHRCKQVSVHREETIGWGAYCDTCQRQDKNKKKLKRYNMRRYSIVGYMQDELQGALKAELRAAVQMDPLSAELSAPRAFAMFTPGTAKVVWEPGDDDPAGQELVRRCQCVEQVPIPISLVVAAYAGDGFEMEIHRSSEMKVPGILGVQLLSDGRRAGWLSVDAFSSKNAGWRRDLPRWDEVPKRRSARTV